MKISRSLLCIIVLLFAHAASAQDATILSPQSAQIGTIVGSPAIQANTYGAATLTRLYVPALAFSPAYSGMTWQSAWGGVYANGPLQAPVVLPAGASVEKIGMWACDDSVSIGVTLSLGSASAPGGLYNAEGIVATGYPQTPGCAVFEVTLPAPVEVSATTKPWLMFSALTGNSEATIFSAGYVDYRLRISDPPVTPTFTDVPANHLFFQYIEALKASGITSGCTPTTYCPGQAVTRGEMAAFLARALGLHWAP